MLSNSQEIKHETYGFHFKESHQQRIAGIYTLGWEKQIVHSYDWNGLTRSEDDVIVFQYTLNGIGEIRIDDHAHELQAGDAFFVKIPSNHRYRLPAHSDEWEFIHLTLFGEEALNLYEQITHEFGHILTLDLNVTPITQIFDLLQKASNKELNNAYETSAAAYSFLMELQKVLLNVNPHEKIPDSIAKALVFIDNQYTDQISLDDIVAASGLSKYHFTRLFHKTVQTTPIQYLTKVRINKSIELLKNKELTVENIAKQVGFANGNYFNKVFRSHTGLSPGKYRNDKLLIAIDHFITN